MLNYRNVLVGVGVVALVLSSARADETELRKMVEALPERLTQLLKENEKGFAGSTLEMSEAATAVGDGLIPAIVKLARSDEWTKKDEEALVENIKRDAQGVASDVFYSRNATGYGGTIVRIESAGAYQSYMETRLCFEVTMRFRDDESFDLEKWHKRWSDAGGSVGSPGDYSGEDEPTEVSVEGGELRFAAETSGGSFTSSALAKSSVRFSAKEGQRLSLATTMVDCRLEKMNDSGLYEAVTKWGRAHDLPLPKSKGGRYQIRFGDEPKDNFTAPQMLIEIR